jgi:two-component system response regulator
MSETLARSRPAEILLVEDNENDVLLTREAFRRAHLMVNLHHTRDGEECMAFLRRQGQYAAAPAPDLVLLDLNMPRKGGREVLAEIAADEALKHLPVIVLTTSAAERDVHEMYRLRCSGYIVKPVDFDQFARVVKQFADYWFTVVVLPSRSA